MYAQQRFAKHWSPQLIPVSPRIPSDRMRYIRAALRAVGGLVIATLATILGGQIIGALFGVAEVGSQRLTPAEIEALVAVGVVVAGQLLSGRQQVAGVVLILAGASAFWVAVPGLATVAILLGLPGVALLAARIVDQLLGSTPRVGAEAS